MAVLVVGGWPGGTNKEAEKKTQIKKAKQKKQRRPHVARLNPSSEDAIVPSASTTEWSCRGFQKIAVDLLRELRKRCAK
jgi:hypothetical protein